MNKMYVFLIGLFAITNGFSQVQGDGGEVPSKRLLLSDTNVHTVYFQKPDIKKLQLEDLQNDEKGNGPWRFGFNNETNLTLQNSGTWTALPDGSKIWRLKINCDQAQTVNLTFAKTVIPNGNELFIYDKEKTRVLGKFVQNHLYEGELGSELIPGQTAIVEYFVAKENIHAIGHVELSIVTHGYRTQDEFQAKVFGQSGACHMNVNCADGLPFADQKRSVVMLVAGANGFCTGALINNTLYDGKPYVLTANHCYSNPANWVFRFNWESPNCENPLTSPDFTSLSGAVLRARRTASDMCLVEITGGLENGTVPTAYNPYFAGWDNSGTNPQSTFGIHHPRGDIKKISFDDNLSMPTQSTISGVTSDLYGVWQITWDRNTTTEQASSGSPLFDNSRRIIGQLWGGGANCSNLTRSDYFGRLFTSWNPTGSNIDAQLEHWLDPNQTGAKVIDGFQPGLTVANDASLRQLTGLNGTLCTTSAPFECTIVNMGQAALTSATIVYGFDGLENQTYNWTGNLAFLEEVQIQIPSVQISSGAHVFSARIETVNNGVDAVAYNNSVQSHVFGMTDPQTVTLSLDLDCYASETNWTLKNGVGEVVYSNELYMNVDEGAKNYTFCLDEQCYTFEITDQYNDGMSGCQSGNGSFQIRDASQTLLAELTMQDANFGSSVQRTFCLGEAAVSEIDMSLDVYPNPTSGIINWNTEKIEQVYVVDAQGKTILKTVVDPLQRNIDISSAVNGLYVVRFVFTDGSQSFLNVALTKK